MTGLTYAVVALVWATMLAHSPREAWVLRIVLGVLTGVFVALAVGWARVGV